MHLYCTDRDGTTVYLKRGVWFGHILRNHGYLEELEQYVRRTVELPTAVHRDQIHARRKCFYRWMRLPDSTIDEYLKVVVEYLENEYGEDEGEIVTAYVV